MLLFLARLLRFIASVQRAWLYYRRLHYSWRLAWAKTAGMEITWCLQARPHRTDRSPARRRDRVPALH
jgi:hypothetical protein